MQIQNCTPLSYPRYTASAFGLAGASAFGLPGASAFGLAGAPAFGLAAAGPARRARVRAGRGRWAPRRRRRAPPRRSSRDLTPAPVRAGTHPDYPYENVVFQGGGAKGVIYGGVVLALEELGILPHVKRVAAASAGCAPALFGEHRPSRARVSPPAHRAAHF